MINGCPECLKKQRQIDALQEENQRLKQKLRYQERKAQQGFFGSSTPSSQIPLKPNRTEKEGRKPKGARPGHLGRGRPVPISFRDNNEHHRSFDRRPLSSVRLSARG